jgi:hypothetical protein
MDRGPRERARIIRNETDVPLPKRQLVRAAPVASVIGDGDQRYVRDGNEELVRRVYSPVRDKNWGTIPPRFVTYDCDLDERSFVVPFTAEHVGDEVNFG